jgi:hypothetical protein
MTRFIPFRLALFLCFLPASIPSLTAATIVQTKGKAKATVTGRELKQKKLQIRLSDVMTVTLSVEGMAPLKVEVTGAMPGNDWLIGKRTPHISRLEDGRERWQLTMSVEPTQPQEQVLQLPALKYRENGGPWQNVVWDPIPVSVTTSIQKPDVSQLKDVPGIEELPPGPGPWWVLPAATGTGIGTVALLGAGAWLLLRRRKRLILPVPPEHAALRTLERLRQQLPDSADQVEPFHTRLDAVMRTYLERRWQVPAGRQTAAELVDGLVNDNKLPAEPLALLRDFFQGCELGKFAPLYLTTAECERTLDLALTFVQQTARDLDKGPAKPEDLKKGQQLPADQTDPC